MDQGAVECLATPHSPLVTAPYDLANGDVNPGKGNAKTLLTHEPILQRPRLSCGAALMSAGNLAEPLDAGVNCVDCSTEPAAR